MKYQMAKSDLARIKYIKNFVGTDDRHPLQYVHTIREQGRTFIEAMDGRMWGRAELSLDYDLPELFLVTSLQKWELVAEKGEGDFPNIEMVRDAQRAKEEQHGIIKFSLDAKLVRKICTGKEWIDIVLARGSGESEELDGAVRITALDKNGDETQVLLMPAV